MNKQKKNIHYDLMLFEYKGEGVGAGKSGHQNTFSLESACFMNSLLLYLKLFLPMKKPGLGSCASGAT